MKKPILLIFSWILLFTSVMEAHFSDDALLFSGNVNPALAQQVAAYVGAPIGKAMVKRFNDGEIRIQVEENVRNKDVFILQSTCLSETQSINDSLMELFLLIRTMKRASAASITAVIPYYGYARQDRKTSPRVPISAADVAMLLEMGGVDRVVTVDLHCGQIQGFFHNVPVDNLYAFTLFTQYFIDKNLENPVVVSPDAGGIDRVKRFIENLGKQGISAGIALISKERERPGVVAAMHLVGSVKGSDAILVDDICDTGGTLMKAAELLKQEGAKRVFVAVTHPIFSNSSLDKISHSSIEEMVITDTIPLRQTPPSNVHCISVAPLLGEAIRRIQCGESLSELFK